MSVRNRKTFRLRNKAKNIQFDLDNISEEDLLELRICDLPLKIQDSWLQDCIVQLYLELEAKGLNFQPECYLADEWLTPENEPVIGIPFYLAHPALTKLEKKMMLEAEGAGRDWCLKLLRHEAGHAFSYAYRLHQRLKWKQVFGSSSQEYKDTYRFRPYSKNFVRHLDGFYAQYHPDEDFVETFAVWLSPHIDWEKQYQGWKALEKLRCVDLMMKSIKGRKPLVEGGKKYWYFKTLRITLSNFYKRKKRFQAEDFPDFHDANLKKIFVEKSEEKENLVSGVDIINRYQRDILNDVAAWSGEKKYVIHDLIKTIGKRCRQLKLECRAPESSVVIRLTSYITTLVMNYLYTGWYRGYKKRK